jgi:hypothetical protein
MLLEDFPGMCREHEKSSKKILEVAKRVSCLLFEKHFPPGLIFFLRSLELRKSHLANYVHLFFYAWLLIKKTKAIFKNSQKDEGL